MKKIIALFVFLVLTVSFICGCGKKNVSDYVTIELYCFDAISDRISKWIPQNYFIIKSTKNIDGLTFNYVLYRENPNKNDEQRYLKIDSGTFKAGDIKKERTYFLMIDNYGGNEYGYWLANAEITAVKGKIA